MANKLGKKLMILSLAKHAKNNSIYYSYEPYVREINLWCELYDQVDIYTEIIHFDESNKHSFAEFKFKNITLKSLWSVPVRKSIASKVFHILTLPFLTIQFLTVLWKYDLIHIRNSSIPSIILGLLIRLFNKKTITKWAGGFAPFPNESIISKIDRKVAGLPSKSNKTLIYSKSNRPNLIPFIPALMSEEEIQFAQNLSQNKPDFKKVLNIVSIGRLHPTKNFELIPEALSVLLQQNIKFNWCYHCIGDGVLMTKMKDLVAKLKLQDHVVFHGALKFSDAQKILAKSHVLIMPGVLEGWPKPIAEAWVHNVFPIAAHCGNIPDILDSEDKGLTFIPEPNNLAKSIVEAHRILSKRELVNLNGFAKAMSLEKFKDRLEKVIKSF